MWVWVLIGLGLLLGCWAIVNSGLSILKWLGQTIKDLFDYLLGR